MKTRVVSDFSNMPVIEMALDLVSCAALVGNIQLALRHPLNTGASAGISKRIAEELIKCIRGYDGAMADVCELGWNPANDDLLP